MIRARKKIHSYREGPEHTFHIKKYTFILQRESKESPIRRISVKNLGNESPILITELTEQCPCVILAVK